jgi:hypothetical protein
LTELAATVAAGEPVFLVEGEKDADSLAQLRLDSTTNADCEPVRGAEVVVVQENDPGGGRHMADATCNLPPCRHVFPLQCLPNLPKLRHSSLIYQSITFTHCNFTLDLIS